jgi:hypothetical protein
MTAHFPSFCAAVTKSLECLSFACWVLVRSASRKILCVVGSEINCLLARRALRRSSRDQKQEECGVGPHPCTFQSDVLQVQGVVKEGSAYL